MRFRVIGALTLAMGWSAIVGAQPYAPPPSDFTAYWEEPAFKDFPYRGPEKAKGVLLWSHGVAGTDLQYQSAPPDVIKDFARAGWDVVKLQRNNLHEAGWTTSGLKHVAQLVQRIAKARADGYKDILAAGQSYGGAISLEASVRTDLLFGVLALAPGHGSDACGRLNVANNRRISDNLQAQLVDAIVPAKASRLVVSVADGDECQGSNDPSALIHSALQRTSARFVHLDASMPVRGHLAAYTEQFRRWYGPCLIKFFQTSDEPAAGETKCVAPSPTPRFLLPDNYKVQELSEADRGNVGGTWSGTFSAQGASSSNNRGVCVIVQKTSSARLETLTAFDPGFEKRLSMVTVSRNFERDGEAYTFRNNAGYRMTLRPDLRAGTIDLSIIEAGGKNNWAGILKPGC